MSIKCLAMHKSELLSDYIGTLPECPTWSDRDGRLYWTDIVKKELHWVQPKTGEHKILQFDEEVGCFALRERGGFILAMRSGIYLSDADGRIEKKVCDNPSNPSVASTMGVSTKTGVSMRAPIGGRATSTAHCCAASMQH